jgi:hypothetical protein
MFLTTAVFSMEKKKTTGVKRGNGVLAGAPTPTIPVLADGTGDNGGVVDDKCSKTRKTESKDIKIIDLNYLIALRNAVPYYPEKLPAESDDVHTTRLSNHAVELAKREDFAGVYKDFDSQMTSFARNIQEQHGACAWVGAQPTPDFYDLDIKEFDEKKRRLYYLCTKNFCA